MLGFAERIFQVSRFKRCTGAEKIGDVSPVATTENYRDQAAECLDSARSVADPKAKLELLVLAKGYLDLADLVEGTEDELLAGTKSKPTSALQAGK